ncbi:VOC family protein [Streptomyces caeni]|uniref:VOC family protein n=1 Tax=Streptomyces caeni TaxID=2307231 RepID=A0ABW4IS32_9ACTN
MPVLGGIHHVKLPVSDVARSLEWYQKVLGIETTMEFKDDDGVLRGLVSKVPGVETTLFALRENPEAAAGLKDFDPISFGVQTRADVEEWAAYMDKIGIEHPPIVEAAIGYILRLQDPDGRWVHIYSWETPDGSDS